MRIDGPAQIGMQLVSDPVRFLLLTLWLIVTL